VEQHFAIVPQPDPTISGLPYLRQRVQEGSARLYGVFIDGAHKASMLCSVWQNDAGIEYRCEVIGGDDGHAGVMDGLAGIDQLAQQAGADVIRIDTVRPGMVKIAEATGYLLNEYILRKKVTADGK